MDLIGVTPAMASVPKSQRAAAASGGRFGRSIAEHDQARLGLAQGIRQIALQIVIDGRVGHTGSLNMIMDHYHKKSTIRRGPSPAPSAGTAAR